MEAKIAAPNHPESHYGNTRVTVRDTLSKVKLSMDHLKTLIGLGTEAERIGYTMMKMMGADSSLYSQNPQMYVAGKLLVHPINYISTSFMGMEHAYKLWVEWYDQLVNPNSDFGNLEHMKKEGSNKGQSCCFMSSSECLFDVRLFRKVLNSKGPGTLTLKVKHLTMLRPVISSKSNLCNSVPAARAAQMQEERETEIRQKHKEDMEREKEMILKEDEEAKARRRAERKKIEEERMSKRKKYEGRITEILTMSKEDSESRERRDLLKLRAKESSLRCDVKKILERIKKD